MNFQWNENTIRWYREADEYTGFYKKAAALIAPSLQGYSSFCDIGCGLGLLDLELSPLIDSITCIDINDLAIQSLRKSIRDRDIFNINAQVMDCRCLEGGWDVIHMSFFGGRSLIKYLPYCRKMIALVAKTDNAAFYPDKYKRNRRSTVADVEQALADQGLAYSLREVGLEFGQPLRSREEAASFVKRQASGISEDDLKDFLAQRLTETGQEEYPFYIPNFKTFGVFEIAGELEIRKSII